MCKVFQVDSIMSHDVIYFGLLKKMFESVEKPFKKTNETREEASTLVLKMIVRFGINVCMFMR